MVLDTGARNCLSINTETRHTEADFQLLQVQPFQYSVLAIQFDASQKGLGAAVLQDQKPVAYTIRVLTQTETHFA